ncbi:hypothetical protein V8J62_15795, partial [Phyllobacterium sp. CCNWLW11]
KACFMHCRANIIHSAKTRSTAADTFDDQYCGALITHIVWRKNLDIGVRFAPDSTVAPLSESVLHALSGKYYSLG